MRVTNDERAAALRVEFDAKATVYESNRLSAWYKAQAEEIVRVLDAAPGEVILDVACGTGWLLRTLLRQNPGVRGVGLELSPRMVEVARERARSEGIRGVTFAVADWVDVDPEALRRKLRLDALQTVCCVSAFHYFPDPFAAVEKVFRILSPSGRFLLLDRAREGSPGTVLWDAVHRLVLRDATKFYRTSELVSLLQTAGFERVKVVRAIRKLFWKGKITTSLALVVAEKGGPDD